MDLIKLPSSNRLLKIGSALARDCQCMCSPCEDFLACFDPCGPSFSVEFSGGINTSALTFFPGTGFGLLSRFHANLNRSFLFETVCNNIDCCGLVIGGALGATIETGTIGNDLDTAGILWEERAYDDTPFVDRFYIVGMCAYYICVGSQNPEEHYLQLVHITFSLQRIFVYPDDTPPELIETCSGCDISLCPTYSGTYQGGGHPSGCAIIDTTSTIYPPNANGSPDEMNVITRMGASP